MINNCTCDNIITYKKADPLEVIEFGDIVMLDPDTLRIKKAVIEKRPDFAIAAKLVVGVCINTDNNGLMPIILDGHTSNDVARNKVDGGTSLKTQTIIVESGSSDPNSREIIQIAYSGAQIVNIHGYVDLGDQLCISHHAGKAKAKDYLNNDYFMSRSIGKVIKYTSNPDKVKVLLDIE